LIYLFVRFVPIISMFEVRQLLDEQQANEIHELEHKA